MGKNDQRCAYLNLFGKKWREIEKDQERALFINIAKISPFLFKVIIKPVDGVGDWRENE